MLGPSTPIEQWLHHQLGAVCVRTHKLLGLRPGGGVLSKAMPKGTTPFCSTVESTRPPLVAATLTTKEEYVHRWTVSAVASLGLCVASAFAASDRGKTLEGTATADAIRTDGKRAFAEKAADISGPVSVSAVTISQNNGACTPANIGTLRRNPRTKRLEICQ